jgi:hypothetical protein
MSQVKSPYNYLKYTKMPFSKLENRKVEHVLLGLALVGGERI